MERYRPANLQQGQIGSGAGTQTALGVATQRFESLSSKLDQFSQMALKQHVIGRMGAAQDQAAKDDAKGVPFHKESIYTEYGKAYNNTRSATFAANAEIDLTTKSAEFAQQFEHQPAEYNNAMKNYREKLSLDAPTPELGNVIAISGRKIQNHQFGKLSIAQNEEFNRYKLNTYANFIGLQESRAINAGAKGDKGKKDLDLIREYSLDYTNAMVEDGIITKAEAEQQIEISEYKIKKGTLESQIRDLVTEKSFDEARNIVSSFGDEIPEGYTVAQYDAINKSITSIYNGGIKTQKAKEKKVVASADKLAKSQIRMKQQGVTSDESFITEETKKNLSPEMAKTVQIQENTDAFMLQFADLTQLEKENLFREKRNSAEFTVLDIEVQKAIEENIKASNKGYKDDPMTQGAAEGSYTLEETIHPGMEDFAKIVEDREFLMGINVENAGISANKLLTAGEVTSFTDILNGEDETAKLQLIQSISNTEQAELIYDQLDKKGADVYVASGRLLSKGQPQVARTIMFGAKADVKLDTGVKASNYTKLVSILQGHDVDTINTMTNITTNYNKGVMGMTGDTASTRDAIEAVYGKITKYNGRETFAPIGVTTDKFETWLSGYTVPGNPTLSEDIQSLAGFWDGDLQLVWEADGKYSIKDSSTGMTIADDSGKPIMIDYYEDK